MNTSVKTLLVSALLGVLAAAGATAFLSLVDQSQHALFTHLPAQFGLTHAPWWWGGILLFVAALMVWFAQRLPGHTGQGPLTGFHFDTPLRSAGAVLLAAAASLIGGVALGPEAPLIVLGTSVGAIVASKQSADVRKAMMFIGGAAAIGAVFGNPLITAFMVLEMMALGAAPVALLLPTMTALATGYVASLGLWGLPGLGVHSLAVPGLPAFSEITPGDLLLAVGVSLVAGAVAVATRQLGSGFESIAKRSSFGALALAAGVTTLMLFFATEVFEVDPNQILFSGNSGMAALVAETSLIAAVFVLFGKALAYSAALGSGFRGGPIFPVTFLGVAVAVIAALAVGSDGVSALAAAGIAASGSAFMKLPATSALLGALLISSAGAAVAPFAIIGAVVGLVVRLGVDAVLARRAEPLGDA